MQKLIPQLPTLENLLVIFNRSSMIEKSFLFDVASKIYVATDGSPVHMVSWGIELLSISVNASRTPLHYTMQATYELCCDMIDVVLDISCIYGVPEGQTDDEEIVSAGFDSHSASIIRLNSNQASFSSIFIDFWTIQVLYLRQVNKYLALVCIVRTENFERQGMIEHNFNVFKASIDSVFRLRASMLERQRKAGSKGTLVTIVSL